MPNIIYQPGDHVKVLAGGAGNVANAAALAAQLDTAPVLVVVRQMPYEPDHYELSDGHFYQDSHLHLLERALAAEVQ
jgi:hypothetical protein